MKRMEMTDDTGEGEMSLSTGNVITVDSWLDMKAENRRLEAENRRLKWRIQIALEELEKPEHVPPFDWLNLQDIIDMLKGES